MAWQYTGDVRVMQASRPWRQDVRINRHGGLQYWNQHADDTVHIDKNDQEYTLSQDENGDDERYYLSWVKDGKWHWRPTYYESTR